MKQITNQQKKELFEVLIPYFESKPEDKWCTNMRTNARGQHCAIGFLDSDFDYYHTGSFIRNVPVSGAFLGNYLILANDGNNYKHLPTPKQRVLAYLNDQVKSL